MGLQRTSFIIKRHVFLGCRILSAVFFLGVSAHASAGTSVQIISQPGDYIGQGAQQTFTTVTAGTLQSQTVLTFRAGGFNYTFEAPSGLLLPGVYEGATRYPFNSTGVAGLDVSGNGRGCNELTGRFIVHELEFGSGADVNKAAIDLEQHCENDVPALFAFIRFNSAIGIVDQDGDSVPDIQDNCPMTANVGQGDGDGDKVGDACDPIQGLTQVTMAGGPGEYISAGQSWQFTVDDGGIVMSDSTNAGLVSLQAGPFTYEFEAGGVNTLTVGDYTGATRYPFNDGTEPGLNVSGDGRGCNELTGSFSIFELERGNDGVVRHFSARFVQYCDGGPALEGLVAFNAEKPLPRVPLAGDRDGTSVAAVGDINRDGFVDYVVGVPGFDIPAAPPLKAIRDAGRIEVKSGKDGSLLLAVNGSAAGEQFGAAVAGGGDIDADNQLDVVAGSPGAAKGTGSVTVIYGPYGGRTQTVTGKTAKSLFGSALALGDTNGDGHADIVVGAPKDDDGVNRLVDAGSVTVLSGNGFAVLKTIYGVAARANAGTSVAAGDADADGLVDVAVGAPNEDGAGSVRLYSLAGAGSTLLTRTGAARSRFGQAVAMGYVDGDALSDVLVGAPADDNPSLKDAGSITAFSTSQAEPLVKEFGRAARAALGSSVATGDVDGDGLDDLIAGAPKDDKPGSGKPLPDAGSVTVWTHSGDGFALLTTLYGVAAKDGFGTAVATADLDHDDKVDVLVGTPGVDMPADKKPLRDVGKLQAFPASGF